MERLINKIKKVYQNLSGITKFIIGLASFVASLIAILQYYQAPIKQARIKTQVPEKLLCQDLFKDTSHYRILILPFFKNCETGRDIGLEIRNRLESLKYADSLSIEVCYLYTFKQDPNFTKEQANKLRTKHSADQIIYGVNSSVNCIPQDTLLEVCVNYLTGAEDLKVKPIQINQVKATLTSIRQGFLQADIDNIIYYFSAISDREKGLYKQSMAKVNKIRNKDNNSAIYTFKASLYQDLNKYDSAIAYYNKAIKYDPSPQNYFDRGVFYRTILGKFNLALKDCIKAFEYSNNLSLRRDALFEFTLQFYGMDRPKTSIQWADEYLGYSKKHKMPDNKSDVATIYTIKGLNLLELNKPEQAIECYNKALALDSKHEMALRNKAHYLADEYSFREALKIYNYLIKTYPNNAMYYIDRGGVFSNIDSTKLSENDFITALKVGNYSAGTYRLLGAKMRSLHQPWLSLRMLIHSARKEKNNAKTHFQLALTYDALGLKSKAILYFESALDLDPYDEQSLFNIAITHFELCEYEEAMYYLNIYIKNEAPLAYKALYYRAICKINTKDKTAMEDMRKSSSMGMSLAKNFLEVRENKKYFK